MRLKFLGNAAAALMLASLGVGAAAYSGPAGAAGDDGAQIFQRRTPATGTYSRQEAEAVGRRLYRALLDRDADAGGLNDTITTLQRAGGLQRRVNEIVASNEFRTRIANRPARDILNQIYRGFFDREPDDAGVTAYLGQLQNRRYTDVIVHMSGSQEFRDKIAADLGGAAGGTASTTDTAAAVNCMEQIVENVRNDLPGAVLLRFESASTRGVAIDVLDNNRRLNYNCEAGASYSYQDGRNTRSAPNESDFPSDAVRACQGAVRAQYSREKGGVDVTFESAGIMPAGGQQAVRGLGFERPQGANFMYQCEMDGTRVVGSRYRGR